jgi:hypothetical protein
MYSKARCSATRGQVGVGAGLFVVLLGSVVDWVTKAAAAAEAVCHTGEDTRSQRPSGLFAIGEGVPFVLQTCRGRQRAMVAKRASSSTAGGIVIGCLLIAACDQWAHPLCAEHLDFAKVWYSN